MAYPTYDTSGMAERIKREMQRLADEEKQVNVYKESPYQLVAEAIDHGQRNKAWKERKNIQRQQIMAGLSKGVEMTFNKKDLEHKERRLKKYFNQNSGDMDEATLEIGQLMLEDFAYQKEKNNDFEAMESQLGDMQGWMQENVGQLGVDTDAEGNKVSRTLNAADLKLIDEMNTEYLDFRSRFKKDHADRLALKPYQHIDSLLDNGKQMNTFLINEAYEDKLIDDKELEAWNLAWDTEDLAPISTYKHKEGLVDQTIIRKNTEDIMASHDEYNKLDEWIDGIGALEVQLEGQSKPQLMTYGELEAEDSALADAYTEKRDALYNTDTGEGRIMNLDSGLERVTGVSWLKQQNIDLSIPKRVETKKQAKHERKIKELIPELKDLPKKGEEQSEDERKTSEKLKKDLEIQTHANRGLIAKGTDIASDLSVYIPAVYLTGKAAKPLVNKAKHFVGSQITKSIDNMKALAGLKPQQAVDWMGNKTVQKQVGVAQRLQDNLAKALEKGGKKSKAVIEATQKLDDYVANTVKKLMKKKKFQGMSAEQMTKLLKDTKKWSTLKMLAGAYKHYPELKQWFNKGGHRAFLPGGAYAGFRALMVGGEKLLGDPTGGLGTAVTGTYIYNKFKTKLTKKLATKAGRNLIAKRLASVGAKRLSQGVLTGTILGAATGPGATATAIIGGLVGTTWALYDAWDILFGEEEGE